MNRLSFVLTGLAKWSAFLFAFYLLSVALRVLGVIDGSLTGGVE